VGLNVVVYRNRKHLHLGPDEKFAQLDPDRGETYFENDELSRRHRERLQAAHLRLGNVTEIAFLRNEIVQLGELTGKLYSKILYSGSHAGDIIAINELPVLLQELISLRLTGRHSDEMRDFLIKLEGLVRAAINEPNPLVFV
jgi:hypothetical protein